MDGALQLHVGEIMSQWREFWITENRCTGITRVFYDESLCFETLQPNDSILRGIDRAAYESKCAEVDLLRRSMTTGDRNWVQWIEENKRLRNQLAMCKEALEDVLKKHDAHSKAYTEDIFPDDKREPCQTTAGRMGRHMIKVYGEYLSDVRQLLAKLNNPKED
jgi:Cdc6-like AAA superfamily ATPase